MLATLYSTAFAFVPLLAQAEEEGPRGFTISWGIILLGVILGLVVALRPTKREERVKLPKRD